MDMKMIEVAVEATLRAVGKTVQPNIKRGIIDNVRRTLENAAKAKKSVAQPTPELAKKTPKPKNEEPLFEDLD